MWVGTSRGDLEVQQEPTHPCWRTSPWHFAAPLTPRWPEPLLPSALDGREGHVAPTHRCLKVAAAVQITLFIIITRSGVCVPSCFSRVWLFATLRAAALQAHLSLENSMGSGGWECVVHGATRRSLKIKGRMNCLKGYEASQERLEILIQLSKQYTVVPYPLPQVLRASGAPSSLRPFATAYICGYVITTPR